MKLKSQNEIYDVEAIGNVISINEKHYKNKIEKITENKFRINLSDRDIIAYGKKVKDNYFVNIEGRQYVFNEIEDEVALLANNDKRAEILPPMPGSVVKILVDVGNNVEEGQSLIVVEAMKMETTLYSPISGIVKEINVKEKEQVNPENYMILVEKEE